MASFAFRLERLRALVDGRRSVRAQELRAAQSVERGAREDLAATTVERRAELEALRTHAGREAVDLDVWAAGQGGYQVLRGREAAAEREVAEAAARLEEARGAYVRERQAGEVLDRLRTRREQVWSEEQARREQAALDDQRPAPGGVRP